MPFDPIVVGDYNLMLQKQRRKEQQLLEERDQELAQKVHSATCEQLVEHVKADWHVCESHAKDLSSCRSEKLCQGSHILTRKVKEGPGGS